MSVPLPPMNLNLPCPTVRREPLPDDEGERTSVAELCRLANVRLRVEDPDAYRQRIVVSDRYPTSKAWDPNHLSLSIIHRDDILDDYPALRMLEILAYTFFDYDARECLCFQSYFDRNRIAPSQQWRCSDGEELA